MDSLVRRDKKRVKRWIDRYEVLKEEWVIIEIEKRIKKNDRKREIMRGDIKII